MFLLIVLIIRCSNRESLSSLKAKDLKAWDLLTKHLSKRELRRVVSLYQNPQMRLVLVFSNLKVSQPVKQPLELSSQKILKLDSSLKNKSYPKTVLLVVEVVEAWKKNTLPWVCLSLDKI